MVAKKHARWCLWTFTHYSSLQVKFYKAGTCMFICGYKLATGVVCEHHFVTGLPFNVETQPSYRLSDSGTLYITMQCMLTFGLCLLLSLSMSYYSWKNSSVMVIWMHLQTKESLSIQHLELVSCHRFFICDTVTCLF